MVIFVTLLLISTQLISQYTNTHLTLTLSDPTTPPPDAVRVPISQEVAIVLSGRIDDPDLLQGKSPLKLVNLVLSPSPRGGRLDSGSGSAGTISLGALLSGLGSSPVILQATARTSPRTVENRLLTPSKYRVPSGRDCGTQTDCEAEAEQVRKSFDSFYAYCVCLKSGNEVFTFNIILICILCILSMLKHFYKSIKHLS